MPSRTPEKIVNSGGPLQPHQDEFHQLAELMGVQINYKVFSILVEFLNMGVDSNTIFNLLKTIKKSTQKSKSRH